MNVVGRWYVQRCARVVGHQCFEGPATAVESVPQGCAKVGLNCRPLVSAPRG